MTTVLSKPIHIAPVAGYDGKYWACSNGCVWSKKHNRIIKGSKNTDGYRHAKLYDGQNELKPMAVHRIIAETFVHNDSPSTRTEVDHRNRDKSDNRASNLVWATRSENCHNRTKWAGCSSKFVGVFWNAQRNKWQASIKVNGKSKHLGLFLVEEEAARAYDSSALEQYGDRARLNFPSTEPPVSQSSH